MQCSKCGKEIEDGNFFCTECGEAIQLVPDYNPFDDIIDHEIQEERQNESVKNNEIAESEKETEAPVLQKKKKNKKKLIIGCVCGAVLICAAIVIFLFSQQNSYSYQLEKGKDKMASEKYKDAVTYLKKAHTLDSEKLEPLFLLADVYIELDNQKQAVAQLEAAIAIDDSSKEAYERLIAIYEEDENLNAISRLLSAANEKIRTEFKEYIADEPEFSHDTGTYNEFLQIELTSETGDVYYTLNNTTPDQTSVKYEEPITLEEGKTIIRAVTINEKGITSDEVIMNFEVELDLPDAPGISPETGTYTEPTGISISNIPEGGAAYYTTDGSTPTPDSSKYTGPVGMEERSYIFSAIVVDANGKVSGVTRRNYELRLPAAVDPDPEEDTE